MREPSDIDAIISAVRESGRETRRSTARALSFLVPGLGHAFHGALGWAFVYAAGFAIAVWRFFVTLLVEPSYPRYVPSNDLPGYLGWAVVIVCIWIVSLFHVSELHER